MSKLLSQGGFGCIYYPGIKCNGQPQTNRTIVSKLQKNDESALNEIAISEVIMAIEDYKLYFLPVIASCPINIRAIERKLLVDCESIHIGKEQDKDQHKVKPDQHKVKQADNYILMDIPYVKNKSFYTILIDMYASKKHIIIGLIENYAYLLEALTILLQHHIVHFDIKSENILYNQNTQLPLLLDFGVSIQIKQVNHTNIATFFYTYSPDYYIWCLEIHVINFLIHETRQPLTAANIKRIATDYVKHNKGLNNFSDAFRQNYLQACETYLTTFVGMEKMKTIDILLAFYPTWDNYSLSILYLKTFSFMFPTGFHKNSLILYFSQMLLYNIHPNPAKRYSLKETQQKFKDIFFMEEQVDNYMDLLESFDYDMDYTTKAIQADINKLNKTRAMEQKR